MLVLLRQGLAALVSGVALMAFAPSAVGATFTVNSTADDIDANNFAGDGTCDTVAGDPVVCTLRAAIQEANAMAVNPGPDLINFDPVFTGNMATSTIVTTGTEPVITETATIDGNDCPAASAFKPCVGFQAAGTAVQGLIVGADNVVIRGLAITNGGPGLSVQAGADNVTIAGNWFGLKLDETAGANNRGLEVFGSAVPAGDEDTVGGETPADRNVFAHNNDDGLRLTGADDVTIKGNYFGTKPDGTTPAPNGTLIGHDNIEVGSVGGNANLAMNNTIGGTQNAAQLATPECDGPCNVIANSPQGIDLETEGVMGEGSAAGATTIKGNFIGLDVTGETAAPNAFRGIQAGLSNTANNPVTVGGMDPGDRNVIAGNAGGGLLAKGGVTVQNNYFGSNSQGDAAIPNLGTVVGDATVGEIANPSTVVGNRFAGNGVSGGRLFVKDETTMTGNVFGIGTGGEVLAPAGTAITDVGNPFGENGNQIGGPNPGDGNTIGNVSGAAPALLINGDDNQVRGNLIGVTSNGMAVPNTGPGIRITNTSQLDPAIDNTIGGNTQQEENVISNSGGDAIELVDDDSLGAINNSGNAILRNRGTNNGVGANDLFIDLRTDTAGDGPGNPVGTGPNAAIQAPGLTEPTTTQMSGSGGNGNTVRVFKTFAEMNDDIRGFAETTGSVTVAGGTWTATFAPPLPTGQCLSANQTDLAGNSSELAQPSLSIGDPCDVTGPTVTINSGPSGTTNDPTADFAFSSEANSTFECRVDGAPFAPCQDPSGPTGTHTSAPLADGPHTFDVRGTDEIGNLGPVASRAFTVNTTPPPVVYPPALTTPPTTTPAPAPAKKCKKKKRKRGAAAAKRCKRKKRR